MEKTEFYSRLWEYLLIIIPPENINRSIGQIKKQVGIKYGNTFAVHSPAHISLVRFLLKKGYERSLLAQLFSFFINKMPVEILLKNFDVFPRHTLYIKVQCDDNLKRLQSAVNGLLTGPAGGTCVSPSNNYYMTVARNLSPAQFESVSGDFCRREINAAFRTNNIMLLKRQYDEYNLKNSRWSGSHNFIMGY